MVQLVKNLPAHEGDLGSIPGLGRSPGEGKGYPLQYSGLENSTDCVVHGVTKSQAWLSNFHSNSKNSTCNVKDLDLIPGLGRSPGEENGYPLQYSCLENSMDRGAWRATVHRVAKDLDTTEHAHTFIHLLALSTAGSQRVGHD